MPSFIVYLKVVNTDKLSDFQTQIEEKELNNITQTGHLNSRYQNGWWMVLCEFWLEFTKFMSGIL